MAKADILRPFILSWEGGFSNVKGDRGGATNKGITLATYKALCRVDNNHDGKIDDKDLKLLTEAQWLSIFKKSFWDRWKADRITNQSIANLLVDWTWNSGTYGIKEPQKVLGVVADGIVGEKTLAAINGYKDQSGLFKKLWLARQKYYIEQSKKKDQSQFLKGWLNRLNGIKYGSLWNGNKLINRF